MNTPRTLGLRVKSGIVIAIVIEGGLEGWSIKRRQEVMLSRGEGKYARFPYHPHIELDKKSAATTSLEAVAAVKATAKKEMAAFLESNTSINAAGVVVGSLIDPAKLASAHMRVHAQEGRLFRESVGKALTEAGIAFEFLLERDAYDRVAAQRGCSPAQLRAQIGAKGRQIVAPWRADEKLATLAGFWKLTPPS